ncbi:Cdc6-like AAA superfamily ATPase [Allocatelliglobosispora scoriae]|uniref:Cdc6-like AAA superfamily ATPase n=1 Tax=Allocatelliglobosispora scoriae TaxID=643052 RepID=A0A841BZ23_9ACTN|nr:AAA family ATPase [Allocatelliglobosispora scoriae]MBB5871970.1 Cdc6-like AAA superfamily ATPase [Allocatelliglobosispora scoriae]
MGVTDEKTTRYIKLAEVFTPGTPVANRDRFAGRVEQVMAIIEALSRAGTHVLLYGERGVGKSSLANVLADFLKPIWGERRPTIRVNCTTQDNYKTIWVRVLTEMNIEVPENWAIGKAEPDVVRRLLQGVTPNRLIILDEFDRIEDDDSLSLMADTLKALSDHAVATRIVIVGVADSIDQLIGEHESIQRSIIEVQLPRMTQKELTDIVDSGLEVANMTIDGRAKIQIGRLAEGLPHYVHSLALTAAQRAILDDRNEVKVEDVHEAVRKVVERHSLLKEYQTAIQSPRPGNLFAHVLAACALADKDRLGYFTASAVREPMTRIMGRPYDIPAFAAHLKAFTEIERGSVLKREGFERRYVYRFRNPLLQPFALLTAISDGVIPADYAEDILGREKENPTGLRRLKPKRR